MNKQELLDVIEDHSRELLRLSRIGLGRSEDAIALRLDVEWLLGHLERSFPGTLDDGEAI